MGSTIHYSHVTVQVEEGIQEVNFDGQGLVLVGSERRAYHVPAARLASETGGQDPIVLTRGNALGPPEEELPVRGLTMRNPVWAFPDSSLMWLGSEGTYSPAASGWSVAGQDEFRKLQAMT